MTERRAGVAEVMKYVIFAVIMRQSPVCLLRRCSSLK